MNRRKALLLIALFSIILIVIPMSNNALAMDVQASEELNIGVSYEFPYKDTLYEGHHQWTELTIKVTNFDETELNGELILFETNWERTTSLAKASLHVESGEESTISFVLPVNDIRGILYLKVKDESKETVVTVNTPDWSWGTSMAIYSEVETDFHFLRSLGHPWDHIKVSNTMKPSQLPNKPWQHSRDLIAIGTIDNDSFTDQQIDALIQWVNSGGIVVFSAPLNTIEAERFGAFIPVQQTKGTSSIDITMLEDVLEEIELPTQQLEIVEGDYVRDAHYFPHEETPLFVGHRYGQGYVIVATYDIASEPMASWKNNRQLWTAVLDTFPILYTMDKIAKHQYFNEFYSYQTMEMPGLNSPSVPVAFFIWIVFIIVVGPLLYLILKKVDRREWAWWIIPMIVIVTSASIYTVGMQRITSESISSLTTNVHIYNENLATVNSSGQFFVLDGGDYDLEIHDGFYAFPEHRRSHRSAWLRHTGEEQTLQFRDMPYMSIAQARAMSYSSDIGYVEHDLYIEGDYLKGTLTNNTKFDLKDIQLRVGPSTYELDPIKQNETMTINQHMDKMFFLPPEEYGDEWEYPYNMTTSVRYIERYEYAYEDVTVSRESDWDHVPVVDLMAKSDTPMDIISIKGENEKQYFQHVITQELNIGAKDGRITYSYGLLPLSIGESTGHSYSYNNQINLEKGYIDFHLHVVAPGVDVEKVEVPLNHIVFQPFEIKLWNYTTEDWEVVVKDESLVLFEQDLTSYLSPTNQLHLRFVNDSNMSQEVPYPFFKVEGVKK